MARMSDDEFVETGGGSCPYCRSKNTCAQEQIQGEGDEANRMAECHDCGRVWCECYILVGYVSEEEFIPDGPAH